MPLRHLVDDEIIELEELILDNLYDALRECNNAGNLGRLLNDLGLYEQAERMFPQTDKLRTFSNGKILVVGAEVRIERALRGIAKAMGISEDRIEFVPYERTTNYDFRNLEYAYQYSVIVFGHTPHSAKGKGDDSSIISHIESRRDCYPECKRLYSGNELGISKSNFRSLISDLMDEGILTAA